MRPAQASNDDLADAVRELHNEVQALRECVDELSEALVWELRQLRESAPERWEPLRGTCMPLDPCTEDFHQRINCAEPACLASPQEELKRWAEHLMQAAPDCWLREHDCIEGEEFLPDEIVQLDAAIYNWFIEYLVTLWQETHWRMLDGDEDLFYLVWTKPEGYLLRRLTPDQLHSSSECTGKLRQAEPTAGCMAGESASLRKQQTLF